MRYNATLHSSEENWFGSVELQCNGGKPNRVQRIGRGEADEQSKVNQSSNKTKHGLKCIIIHPRST